MEREFIVNYENLDNLIIQWQRNPERTDWELTMLRNNLKNTTQDLNELRITINESNWEIKINWKNEINFKTIPTWYNIDKKIRKYRQVKQAMEEAKNRWIYNEIFKEINKE